MITLCYLPINAAWTFIFHHAERAAHTGTPISMGNYGTLFDNRDDAAHAAELMGLKVGRGGETVPA
ncbi:hypothetical protein [Roseomonas sp. WA12]